LQLFVVMDPALFGKGVFAVFSDQERAAAYGESQTRESPACEVRSMTAMGGRCEKNRVFAAHTYDGMYDVFVLDGLYVEPLDAEEAAGDNGLVIEFEIDRGVRKQIFPRPPAAE
jgi:hypothetical protein